MVAMRFLLPPANQNNNTPRMEAESPNPHHDLGLRQPDRHQAGFAGARQRVGPASAPISSLTAASNWLAEAAIVNLCSS
jgi:hypothetical protein